MHLNDKEIFKLFEFIWKYKDENLSIEKGTIKVTGQDGNLIN